MSSQSENNNANFLVVEDEIVFRMRAVDIVEDAGFTAVEAVDADDARRVLESRADMSLMLSDIQMPGSMDGLDRKFIEDVHQQHFDMGGHSIRPDSQTVWVAAAVP